MTGASEAQIVSSWNKTQSQVLSYAKIEKLAVHKLISRYHEYQEQSNDSKS